MGVHVDTFAPMSIVIIVIVVDVRFRFRGNYCHLIQISIVAAIGHFDIIIIKRHHLFILASAAINRHQLLHTFCGRRNLNVVVFGCDLDKGDDNTGTLSVRRAGTTDDCLCRCGSAGSGGVTGGGLPACLAQVVVCSLLR